MITYYVILKSFSCASSRVKNFMQEDSSTYFFITAKLNLCCEDFYHEGLLSSCIPSWKEKFPSFIFAIVAKSLALKSKQKKTMYRLRLIPKIWIQTCVLGIRRWITEKRKQCFFSYIKDNNNRENGEKNRHRARKAVLIVVGGVLGKQV